MRDVVSAALRRLRLALLVFVAAAVLPAAAWAQSVEPLWSSKGCNGCHSTPTTAPPDFGALIPFSDDTLFASQSAFLTRVANGPNLTMQNFGNGVGTNSSEQAAVYNYLVNVRNAVVTSSVSAFPATDVGVTSGTTRQVVITNYRGEALSFTTSVSNSDFQRSNNCSGSVAAQSTCTITVSFTPSAGSATTRTGNLTVTFTSGTSFTPTTRVIALNGTVNPPVFSYTANAGPFSARLSTPTDINFGTLRNTGSATLVLSSIIENPASAVFSMSPASGSRPNACTTTEQLGANQTCEFWARFTPAAQGSASATFRFAHNAAGSPDDITVSATGTQPLISPTTASLNFSNVQLGATSVAQSVVMTNTGNMNLTFNADPKLAAARSGANPSDFTVTTPGCTSSAGATLAASGTCTISVTFTPPLGATTGVTRTATLTVSTDANNNGGALTISLSGTPVALPEPTVTGPTSDFPDTVIGQSSAPTTRQITISNTRTHAVVYDLTAPTDFPISAESCAGRSVPAAGSCTITLLFQPQLSGGESMRNPTIPISLTGTGGDPNPATVNVSVAGRALLPLGAPASLAPNSGFGTPVTAATLLSNRSASAITLSALSFSGTAAADYTLDATNGCTVGATIGVGSSCSLVVRFNPVAGGTRNATLTITHNALGSPQAIALNGSATQGAIQLSSFALTFASTALNANSAQPITVKNNGTQALNFSAFNLAGAAAADYTRSGTCAAGTPLAVGDECTLTITFQPTVLGTRSASLTIQSDASNGPATVTLTGTGVPIPAPLVTLAPTALDFGTQTVGNPYPARTIRLSNSGNADLHTTSVVVEGGAFATSSTCPATLVPGAGCDVQIQFAPVLANTDYTGALRVVSDAAGSPHTAPLTGRGSVATLAALTWSPLVAQIDFGTVSAGTLSTEETAMLRNDGPGGVTLTVINAVGPDAVAFAVTGGTCAVGGTLFEGQTCTVLVRFAPSIAGARSAQLQVASTGSFPPTLSLVGTGLGGPTPGVALSVAALDLGPTRVGARSAPGEITLSSNGSGALQVTALAADGPFTVQTRTCPALPFTLPAGAECSIGVIFAPQAQGGVTGTLKVTTSASGTPTEIALSGEGEPAPDLSSGGCSIAAGESLLDPTLWSLVLLAVAVLAWRRYAGTAARRAERPGRSRP
jgi:hypothetical protein